MRCADLVRAMRAVPQPFIGLGHGSACGAGFSLLLACDVRYGAPDLRMNAAYLKIGLGGADMGSSWFLPRMVGASVAAELLLSGRFLHAERALRPFSLSGRGHEPRVVLDVATSAMVRAIHLAHVSISGFGANNRYPARVFEKAVKLLEARQMHAAAKALNDGFRRE